ncbi:hypothetical protein HY642_06355 [Candidatus Woesearchaeota archaeon]|nr:hypothetical protein [Candidatus Woesearchaeota archaeon]
MNDLISSLYRMSYQVAVHHDGVLEPQQARGLLDSIVALELGDSELAQMEYDLAVTRFPLFDAFCMWLQAFGSRCPIEMLQLAKYVHLEVEYAAVRGLPDCKGEPSFEEQIREMAREIGWEL